MAKKAKRDDDELAIERPEEFLRRERAAQRVGVVFFGVLVVAGLTGVFGDGPLAHATAASGNATIRYERFARQTYRTELEISLPSAGSQPTQIKLSRAFLDNVDMLDLRPSNTLKSLDDEVATFELPPGSGPATLLLHYEPKSAGVLDIGIAAGSEPPTQVRQFIFF